ncbi:MAG: T9SS type A sorting domain-containing protein [Bacteroidales bacterium]|nr:T9SS type A sorting domain-containing protein [Bacteroidales bacterium]MDD4829086.1 T9SS type A sorting domain-containing protein [Bacteroidales bacterium]
MKKYYFFILCFLLFGMQDTFSQNYIENRESKSPSGSKTTIDLMALDSITYCLAPNEPTIFEYDLRGNLTLIKDVFSKTENAYNVDSLLISSLYYIWDYDSNQYREHEFMEFTYDNNRLLVQEVMTVNIDNIWLTNYRRNYEYTNGYKTRQIDYFFNTDSNAWIMSSKRDFVYNTDNLLINENSYYFDNYGNEHIESQISNTYDQNDNMIYSLYEQFNDTSALVNGSKTYFIYDSSNLLTEQLFENYSIYNGSTWLPSYKMELSYNSNDLMLSRYNYMYNNNWNLHSIDSFFYDNYDNKVLVKAYVQWGVDLLCNHKFIYNFDYNYTSDEILKFKPSPLNYTQSYLDNYNHMLTHYINANNYEPSNESTWSYDTNIYNYSLKTFILTLPTNILYDGTNLILYPNPTNEKTIISLEGVGTEIKILIIDIQGKEVLSLVEKPIGNKLELSVDVSKFKKGTYFINIRSGKYSQTKKLIVN